MVPQNVPGESDFLGAGRRVDPVVDGGAGVQVPDDHFRKRWFGEQMHGFGLAWPVCPRQISKTSLLWLSIKEFLNQAFFYFSPLF